MLTISRENFTFDYLKGFFQSSKYIFADATGSSKATGIDTDAGPGAASTSTGEAISLSIDNLLLRECRLENTEWVVACVIYTGPEAKISLVSHLLKLEPRNLRIFSNIYLVA